MPSIDIKQIEQITETSKIVLPFNMIKAKPRDSDVVPINPKHAPVEVMRNEEVGEDDEDDEDDGMFKKLFIDVSEK